MADKTTRRSKHKHRALVPELNLKSRYEDIADLASYAHLLTEEEKDWLNQFSEEYICASFNKDVKKRLHQYPKDARDIYKTNNARNRCIFSRLKATGTLNYIEDLHVIKNKEQQFYKDPSLIIEEMDSESEESSEILDYFIKEDSTS